LFTIYQFRLPATPHSKALGWFALFIGVARTSARLSNKPLEEMALELKTKSGGDILVGSRSLIVSLTNENLIDEYQLCIHPVLVGKGLPLFDKLNDRTVLKLVKTKTFTSGAVIVYYR
jgi:dihydrofolate reductase